MRGGKAIAGVQKVVAPKWEPHLAQLPFCRKINHNNKLYLRKVIVAPKSACHGPVLLAVMKANLGPDGAAVQSTATVSPAERRANWLGRRAAPLVPRRSRPRRRP